MCRRRILIDDSPQRHRGHGEEITKNSVISVSLFETVDMKDRFDYFGMKMRIPRRADG